MAKPSIKVPNVTNADLPGIVTTPGTLVFNTSINQLQYLNSSGVWIAVSGGGGSGSGTAFINNADFSIVAPVPHQIFFELTQNHTLTLPDASNPDNGIVDGTLIQVYNFNGGTGVGGTLTINSFLNNAVSTITASQSGFALYSTSLPFTVDNWTFVPNMIEVDGKSGSQPVKFTDIYEASEVPLVLEAGTGKPFIVQNAAGTSVASFGESLSRIWQNFEIGQSATVQQEGFTTGSGVSTSGTQDIRGTFFEPTKDFILNQIMYFDANFPSGSRNIIVCYANSAEIAISGTVNKSDPLDGTGLWRVNSASITPLVMYAGESYFIGTLIPPGEQFTDQPSVNNPLITNIQSGFQLNATELAYPNPVTFGPAGSAYGNVNFGILGINRAGAAIFSQGFPITGNANIDNPNIGVTNINSSASNWTLTLPLNDDLAANASFNAVAVGTGTLTIQAAGGVTLNGVLAGSVVLNQYDRTVVTKISANTWVFTTNNSLNTLQNAYNNGNGTISETGTKPFVLQNAGGSGDNSALLDMISTNRGSRPYPSMTTTQKNAIASPANGLIVYDTTLNKPSYWNGSAWVSSAGGNLQDAYNNGSGTPLGFIAISGNTNPIFLSNSTTGSPQSSIVNFNFVNPNSFAQPGWGYDLQGLNTAPTIVTYARMEANVESASAGFEFSNWRVNLRKNGVPITGILAGSDGSLSLPTLGGTLKIAQGSNACAGTNVTLAGGTVTVNTTAVATGDIILLNCTSAVNAGFVTTTITNGVSFTIRSTNILDSSTYNWVIIKAA